MNKIVKELQDKIDESIDEGKAESAEIHYYRQGYIDGLKCAIETIKEAQETN